MDSLFHFFSSLLLFSGDLSFKQVFIPILIGSMVPDTFHFCTYIWVYIKKEEPFSKKYEMLWYYGKILHSVFILPLLFIPAYYSPTIWLISKVYLSHILIDILTHKQDKDFFLFPLEINIPQLGIFDWGHVQEVTNKVVFHRVTYGLWVGIILGLFIKMFRIF